jgi:hypothetical protein
LFSWFWFAICGAYKMPFIGLTDVHGKEIKGDGYHRIDMSEINFKITPPRSADVHLTFVNTSTLKWPVAQRQWPDVYGCAVFTEIDDESPSFVRPFSHSPQHVSADSFLAIGPGQLTMDQTITPNERRNAPPNRRCPKCGTIMEPEE